MNFGDALVELRKGARVRRAVWVTHPPQGDPAPDGRVLGLLVPEPTTIPPFIGITAGKTWTRWAAAHEDLLALDWEVIA